MSLELHPLAPLVGGLLIGTSAACLLLGSGRTAGISGILGGALDPTERDGAWRLYFLGGLIGAGLVLGRLWPAAFSATVATSGPLLIGAGLLVGIGTTIGSGCTSGHGVCGIGRLSPRSLVATLTFMGAGVVAVFVLRHLLSTVS